MQPKKQQPVFNRHFRRGVEAAIRKTKKRAKQIAARRAERVAAAAQQAEPR